MHRKNKQINLVQLRATIIVAIVFLSLPLYSQTDLPTVAEKSEFKSTSSSAEVVEFIEQCSAKSAWVSKIQYGETVEKRPLVAAITGKDASIADRTDKTRILILGNIHSGECAGKEALLQLLREITLDENHPWLAQATIVIAPNYNADGNDRIGKNEFHRPGQIGPENGMGVRENAQQLDLNRDFIKLESPEARSLVKLIDEFDPHLFIDCHTTNGSQHRYKLTYDVPHNLCSPQTVRDFLRNKMMPIVTKRLAEKGTDTFYYGNLARDNSRWFTFGHEPRYSTEYVGLRGRLAVLSEAYSYISYQDRIIVSYDFVNACVNYVLENGAEINDLLEETRNQFVETAAVTPEKIPMHLGARPVPFKEKVTILAYDGEKPKDYEVEFVGDFEATHSVSMPYAYLIGDDFAQQVERLQMHGITISKLEADTEIEVTQNRIKSIRKADREFQGHNMVSTEATTESTSKTFIKGTYLIKLDQPLGRLASYMLEPTSDDGLITWNFFDPWLAEGSVFPVYRIEKPVDLPVELATSIPAKTKLTLDLLVGANKVNFSGSTAGVPEWVQNKNEYKTTWTSRPVVVDAMTGAMSPIENAWKNNEIAEALKSIGIEDAIANKIAGDSEKAIISPDQKHVLIENDGRSIVYRLDQKNAFELSLNANPIELAEFSPNGTSLAFVRNGNLQVFSCVDGSLKSVTNEESTKILSGKLDWVYQEELYGRGNFKAFWWAPDSSKIAFLQLDVSQTRQYTVVDDAQVEVVNEVTAYPLAGESQAVPKLLVYDLATAQTVTGNLGDHANSGCDIVVSGVSWKNDSTKVVAQVQNRQQTWLDFCLIDPTNGSGTVLFQDQTPAWIESPGDPVWLENGSVLWTSPRSGKNQIYVYEPDGSDSRQLTNVPFGIQSLLGYRKEDQSVLFAAKLDGIRQHIFSQKIDANDAIQLTENAGHHTAIFSDDFSYFFDIYSTAAEPQKVALRDSSGNFIRTIDPNLDDSLRYLDISAPTFSKIKIGEGENAFEADCMTIFPPDFDEGKEYPVLYHVYAGPQAPTVRDQFRGGWYLWHQMLAQHGYVIFMCDNRSATHYGADNAWPVHRNLGELELVDIEAAVSWLHQQSWVAKDRIGIWGWSYGGYMTAYAMTHSQSFKAGISGAPVTDWRNYDSIYTERYMGLPVDNPEGYDRSSVVKAADNLHGRMLLIHGTIDDNVHISNSMQLVYALQNAGKSFDMMLYPKSRHGITNERQVEHLRDLMTRFILKNL